jgi:hypothetical protein
MTPEETARMKVLCEQIQTEQDRQKFWQLVLDLSILLERKSERLKGKDPPPNPISH